MKSILSVAMFISICWSAAAHGGDCCADCGSQCSCQKVCRLKCTTKKVPKVEYSCECEDFCVPGPSCQSFECDECGKRKRVYTPTCAHVRTRTKLLKKETMVEKPSYEWVVEDLCANCRGNCNEKQGAANEAQKSAETQKVEAQKPAAGNQPRSFFGFARPTPSAAVEQAAYEDAAQEAPALNFLAPEDDSDDAEQADATGPVARASAGLRRMVKPVLGSR